MATSLVESGVSHLLSGVIKAPLYVAGPIDAALGFIPWSGVPQVYSQIWNNSVAQLAANAISGQLTTQQAQAIRARQTAQLKQAGATTAQVQQADTALARYIQTPVAQGGAGGTVDGLTGALGVALTPSASTTSWLVVGGFMLVGGFILIQMVKG